MTIVSQQDTAREAANAQSINAGINVGFQPGIVSGSFGYSSTDGDANYKRVNEQSGIFAGEDGFDLTVGGNTGLVGRSLTVKRTRARIRLSPTASRRRTYRTQPITMSTPGVSIPKRLIHGRVRAARMPKRTKLLQRQSPVSLD